MLAVCDLPVPGERTAEPIAARDRILLQEVRGDQRRQQPMRGAERKALIPRVVIGAGDLRVPVRTVRGLYVHQMR
ncbi:hypothetical protein SCNU_03122 [Gordonia neofelifaecis NRRL B-59395]|uniref:Uncharacterized protein n=1 Tax=Gordonia neofelifaecis NRRL B-59395 TaxID=644548 RepID=F1YFT2_9ACTN|nr:hypothetical protein SCNU_03122 [Gordonia neofelifaecis NRRL B-59395]